MKKQFMSILIMTLFLAACSNDSEEEAAVEVEEEVEVEASADESEELTQEVEAPESTEEETEDVVEESPPEEPKFDVGELTVQEKTALVLLDERSADYTYSAEELIQERYLPLMQKQDQNIESTIFEIVLQDYGTAAGIEGLPEGMVIYNITPSYGNFVSFLGFNDDTAVVYGSQYNVQTYDEILAGGVELDLGELYEMHGSNENLSVLTEKIKVADQSDDYIPVSKEAAAKIWAFKKSESAEVIESLHFDYHNGLVNPYFPEATVSYPMQTYVISSSPAAAGGNVVFTMNADGSFRVYDAPVRFSDERWLTDAAYSKAESDKILNSSEVHHIDELDHLYIEDVLSKIVE